MIGSAYDNIIGGYVIYFTVIGMQDDIFDILVP